MCCSVNVSVCFVRCVRLTVILNCLEKLDDAMCLGEVAIPLLNVIELFNVCDGALLERACMVFL